MTVRYIDVLSGNEALLEGRKEPDICVWDKTIGTEVNKATDDNDNETYYSRINKRYKKIITERVCFEMQNAFQL